MAKKTTKKAAKKKTTKKVAGAEAPKLTKTAFVTELAEATGGTKADATAFLEAMGDIIGKQLGRRGPGEVSIPGLMKVKVTRKPATKAREGINPFTKEPTTFAAKPARNVVKITPLKNLKDMV